MSDRDRHQQLFAVAASAALIWAAAQSGLAAEPGAATPDFSANGAAWVFGLGDYIAVPGEPSPTPKRSGPPVCLQQRLSRQRPPADLSHRRSPQSQHQAVGEGDHEARERKGAGGRGRVHVAIELPAGGRARLHDGGGRADPYRADAQGGDHDLLGRRPGAPHLSRRAPFGEPEAVVVRRIGGPLRGRYAGGGHHRHERQDLSRQFPHAAQRKAARRRALQDDRRRQDLEVTFRVDDPDTFNQPWTAIGKLRRVQMPMHEEACAENNQHLVDYHIPVADKPDF